MKRISYLFLALIAIAFSAVGQNNSDVLDLGDGKILDVKQLISDDFVTQEFKVEVKNAGKYYFAAWVNGSSSLENGKLEYIIQVNDDNTVSKINAKVKNPHPIDLSNEQIQLQTGINTIRMTTRKPDCPNIEFIKVSSNKENCFISDSAYNKYIDELSKLKLPDNYAELKISGRKASISIPDQKSTLPNPEGNYQHEMDVDFEYSYFAEIYIGSYGTITLETTSATSDPILQLISKDLPGTYSWTDDDGGDGYNSKIVANITFTGSYYIFIRKSPISVNGTCNLLKNGTLYASNCAVAGTQINCSKTVSEVLNWFTADLTGRSLICIENQNGNPGKIIAFNHQWTGQSDFNWGYNSRIRSNLNTNIRSVIVLSYLSYYPTGNCDEYMNCKNSTITPYFPNLKSMDAIQSAPQSSIYNCISWSGGITNDWYWPPDPYDPYYAGSPLASFDNYYGSVRYIGAMTYNRSGATVSNSVVDLWALNGNYTHGSVKKPGNNHPHGYDWESKPGSLMRTFHPRNALSGSSYGSVSNYYKPTSTKSTMLLDESIARGLSVIENVELTTTEKNIISNKISLLTINQQSEFENKYTAWKQTWENPEIAMHSNPRMYAKSKEYQELIDYCKGQGKSVWPMIFDKFQQGDFFAINAIEDLTLAENWDVLDKVKKESSLNSTNESGAVIVRFPRTIAMKYIKELLKSSTIDKVIDDKGITYSNSFKFNVFPDPVSATSQISFYLPIDSKVSAQLVDLNGRILSVVINDQVLNAGNHSCNLNVPDGFKGICLVKLLVNNNVNVQLIVVQ